MADLVDSVEEVIENIETLRRFRNGNEHERKFHNVRIKNGKLFVAMRTEQGYAFAPSKFAGYRSNNISHENELGQRDGRRTNKVLIRVLGKNLDEDSDIYKEVDQNFLSYCSEAQIEPSRHHKVRQYWLVEASNENDGISRSRPSASQVAVEEGEAEDRTIQFRRRNAQIMKERKKRDKYMCQACGFILKVGGTYIIDCHHKSPLSGRKSSTITDIDDLICLCPTCHRIAHTGEQEPLDIDGIREARKSINMEQ